MPWPAHPGIHSCSLYYSMGEPGKNLLHSSVPPPHKHIDIHECGDMERTAAFLSCTSRSSVCLCVQNLLRLGTSALHSGGGFGQRFCRIDLSFFGGVLLLPARRLRMLCSGHDLPPSVSLHHPIYIIAAGFSSQSLFELPAHCLCCQYLSGFCFFLAFCKYLCFFFL